MKRIIKFSSVLTMLLLSIACNEIERVGIVADSSVGQMRERQTQSVNVTQNEAVGVANMFIRSNAGDVMLPTKGAFSNTKMIRSTETVREDGQDLKWKLPIFKTKYLY